jgi:ribosomal-protein-alanine N-acetyltransferase
METERMILSKPSEKNRMDIFQLKKNEQGRLYLGGAIAEEKLEERFNEIRMASKPEQYWIVHEKESGAFIGLVSITLYHDGIHYEISYELLPDFWGKGYGTEIMKKVLNFGFKDLQFDELYAETQMKNAASVRLLEKIGMKHIDTLQRFGEEQVVYAIQSPYSPIVKKGA